MLHALGHPTFHINHKIISNCFNSNTANFWLEKCGYVKMLVTVHVGGDDSVFLLSKWVIPAINWPIIAICCFWVSEKFFIKLLKFSLHFWRCSYFHAILFFPPLRRIRWLLDSFSSTVETVSSLHCVHLSSLSLLDFAHSCWIGHLNHPNQLGSQHCYCVMCCVNLNFHWTLLRTCFINVRISQHPKIVSILL